MLGVGARISLAQAGVLAATTPTAGTLSTLWSANPAAAAAAANTVTLRINTSGELSIPSVEENRLNAFSSAVSVTTAWSLTSILSTIDVVAYFPAPFEALVNGATALPSSRVLGRVQTGIPTAFSAFTQNPVSGLGSPGGSLHLFRQYIIWPASSTGSRTDNLDLQLDLRNLKHLPSGAFAGTLHMRAIAY